MANFFDRILPGLVFSIGIVTTVLIVANLLEKTRSCVCMKGEAQ